MTTTTVPSRPWGCRLSLLAVCALLGACASAPVPQAPLLGGGAPAGMPARQVAALAAVAPATAGAPEPVALDQAIAATPETMAIDPLQPTERIDLDAAAAQTDLWARVRRGMAMPDQDNDLVRKWEQWYAGKPDYVQRMTERGGRYLFHIVEEVDKRGMPAELALLPFIESAYNPQAMSTAKASGMWQFVPATGRDFALKQNLFRDDRRNVLASTRAALDYLQTLHNLFDDWQLALAAYNWGQGNVQRAIARNLKAGLPTDYDSLKMPDETRNYLPKLQAVKNIVLRPEAFALALPPLRNHPYFVSVTIERDIDIDLAARLAGLPLEEFKQLNPQMNKPVILAAGTPQVLLPFENASLFARALPTHRGLLASWTAWQAPRTLKPAEAARLVGTTEEQLREINAIPKGMVVKAGSTLLVPRSASRIEDVAVHVADNAVLALAPDVPPFKRVSFRASRRGDSVAAVAKRYHVAAAQVAQWNSTTAAAHFKPGQVVVLLLPTRTVAARAVTRVASREPVKASPPRRVSKPAVTARMRVAQN